MNNALTVLVVVLVVALLGLSLSVRIIKQYEQGVLFHSGRVAGDLAPGLRVFDQIAQTTLRKEVGQHALDETLSETDSINTEIRKILDVATEEWGVRDTMVELKDIRLPDSGKRATARQAEAEPENRAKVTKSELGAFLAREVAAADSLGTSPPVGPGSAPMSPP